MDILHEYLCTFVTSPTILLRMRSVSDKSCTENQTTHHMFKFFPENRVSYEIT